MHNPLLSLKLDDILIALAVARDDLGPVITRSIIAALLWTVYADPFDLLALSAEFPIVLTFERLPLRKTDY